MMMLVYSTRVFGVGVGDDKKGRVGCVKNKIIVVLWKRAFSSL